MKKIKLMLISAVATMATLISSMTAQAQLAASEPFNYTPPGALLTSLTGDGTGFSTSPNAWVTDYDSWVATGSSLVYVAAPGSLLAFSGGAAANNTVYYPRTYRQLAAPLGGGTNVVWISFVSHRNETTPINWWLALQDGFSSSGTPIAPDYLSSITSGSSRIFFGENYGVSPGYNVVNGDGAYFGGPAVTTANTLWVIKLDFNAGLASYWWNPTTLGGADPDIATAANSGGTTISNWTFNAIWLNQQPGAGTAPGGVETTGIQIDEIRIGTNYASVTPSIAGISTTTTLTSSANQANVGTSITFTATVAPSAATGTVTFSEGATVLGTGVLSGGVATLVTSSLSAGYHNILANYGGNGTYAPSGSSVLKQEVDASPKKVTTVLLTGPTNIKYGDNTYYTAYVQTNGVTAINTLDTIKFYDGAILVGTAGSLEASLGGQGSFAIGFTAPLTVGTHNITAVYSGDPIYAGSTSAVYPVTITYPDQTFVDAFTNVSGPNPTDSGGWAAYYGNWNQNWQRTSTNMVSTGYAYDGIYKNWLQAPGNDLVSISYDIAHIGLNGTWISLSLFTNVSNLGGDGPANSHGAPQIRINDKDITGTNVTIQIFDAGNNFLGGIDESLSSSPYSNVKLIYNTTTGLGDVQFDGTNIFTAVNFNTTGKIQGYVLDDLVIGPGSQIKNFVLSSANSSAPPTLTVSRSSANIIVSWPSVNLGWTLQTNTSLSGGAWTAVAGSTAVTSVTNNSGSGNVFYRLKQ